MHSSYTSIHWMFLAISWIETPCPMLERAIHPCWHTPSPDIIIMDLSPNNIRRLTYEGARLSSSCTVASYSFDPPGSHSNRMLQSKWKCKIHGTGCMGHLETDKTKTYGLMEILYSVTFVFAPLTNFSSIPRGYCESSWLQNMVPVLRRTRLTSEC